MPYAMCACFLIVQLLATGALRPFPWGAYELRPPELGLAAKLSGGEGGDRCPVCPKPTGPQGQEAIPVVHRQKDACQPAVMLAYEQVLVLVWSLVQSQAGPVSNCGDG